MWSLFKVKFFEQESKFLIIFSFLLEHLLIILNQLLVLIDELTAVGRTLLTSTTLGNSKTKRPDAVRRFNDMVKFPDLLVIADADLDSAVIDNINRLRPAACHVLVKPKSIYHYPFRTFTCPHLEVVKDLALMQFLNGDNVACSTDKKSSEKGVKEFALRFQRVTGKPESVFNFNADNHDSGLQFVNDMMPKIIKTVTTYFAKVPILVLNCTCTLRTTAAYRLHRYRAHGPATTCSRWSAAGRMKVSMP